MPTMAGAFAYDLLKSYKLLSFNDAAMIVLGFIAIAFVSALFVVKTLLDYVSRHGFTVFAWWRIVVGAAGLALAGVRVTARDDWIGSAAIAAVAIGTIALAHLAPG